MATATTSSKPSASKGKGTSSKGKGAKRATTYQHPPKVRQALKAAGLSEQSELTPDEVKRARNLPARLRSRQAKADWIMKGEATTGNGNGRTTSKAGATLTETQRAVMDAANQVAGPKYPIVPKQVAAVWRRKGSAPNHIKVGALQKFARTGKAKGALTETELEQLRQFNAGNAGAFKHPTATTDLRQLCRILVAIHGAK